MIIIGTGLSIHEACFRMSRLLPSWLEPHGIVTEAMCHHNLISTSLFLTWRCT